MIPFLYDVTDRSGNLVIDNATFAEVVEGLNCSKAQANNARTSGDLIFRKYEMHRVDRKLSRKTMGWNPPDCLIYTSLDYHVFIGKPWGGLTALKKQEATRTVEDFNRNIQNRNYLLREARRYTR